MESDLQFPNQYHTQMNNPGLTRYQSAPSSYFSSLLECEEFFNRPTSPETERIFARFLANSESNVQNQSFAAAPVVKQDSPVRNEEEIAQKAPVLNQSNYGGGGAPVVFQSQSKPPLPDQSSNSGIDYRRLPPMKSGGSTSNLVRHSSSPAGLFANISIEMENGYAVMRGMGDYGTVKREAGYCSCVSRPPAQGGRMSTISETGSKNIMGENSSDNNNVVFDETRSNDYVTGYPVGPWDDNASSSVMSQRLTDDDRTLSGGLNAPETQNRESGIPATPRLAHHLSLPKTAAEMSAIEQFLHLQDSVPCKIRAKRGFATHPRSIAERVRRTKISERMRKLQDLVPNMDKQTNTSDMLDLAVDYIKDLQKQVKTLSDSRAKCTCDIKQEM